METGKYLYGHFLNTTNNDGVDRYESTVPTMGNGGAVKSRTTKIIIIIVILIILAVIGYLIYRRFKNKKSESENKEVKENGRE